MPYSFECVGETPIDKYLTLRQKENVARTQEDILHMVESVCLVKMMKLKYFFEKMKESLPPLCVYWAGAANAAENMRKGCFLVKVQKTAVNNLFIVHIACFIL